MANYDSRNWGILGWGWSNPVPGDIDEVDKLAQRFQQRSDQFAELSKALSNIQSSKSGMYGQWIDRFSEKLGTMPADFSDFAGSYASIAGKLSGWKFDMQIYQSDALRGLQMAEEAKARMQRAQNRVDNQQATYNAARWRVLGMSDDASDSTRRQAKQTEQRALDLLSQYRTQLSDAEQDFENGKRIVRDAKDGYNTAGKRWANSIGDIDYIPRSVTGFDRFYYSDGWQILVGVVSVAGLVVGIVGFFVGGWVITLITAAVSVIQAALTWIEFGHDDASFAETFISTLIAFADTVVPFISMFKTFKSNLALKTTRGKINRFKKTAFEKSDALNTIRKNMNKTIAKNPKAYGVPKKSLSEVDSWRQMTKRISENKQLRNLFYKEFAKEFVKQYVFDPKFSSITDNLRKSVDKRYSKIHQLEAQAEAAGDYMERIEPLVDDDYGYRTEQTSSSKRAMTWAEAVFALSIPVYGQVSDIVDRFDRAR